MTATFQTDGAIANMQGGNDIGGLNTGIGFGANFSSQTSSGNFTVMGADLPAAALGNGSQSSSASNLGQMANDISFTAGSGYTNGTYALESDGARAVSVEFTIAGGSIVDARIVRPGSGLASAPTFTLANARNLVTGLAPGGGTGGAITVSIGLQGRIHSLGAGHGAKKGVQVRVSGASIAAGASGTGLSPLVNRSGRALASGDTVVAVAP
jgi:hypothetical protein